MDKQKDLCSLKHLLYRIEIPEFVKFPNIFFPFGTYSKHQQTSFFINQGGSQQCFVVLRLNLCTLLSARRLLIPVKLSGAFWRASSSFVGILHTPQSCTKHSEADVSAALVGARATWKALLSVVICSLAPAPPHPP